MGAWWENTVNIPFDIRVGQRAVEVREGGLPKGMRPTFRKNLSAFLTPTTAASSPVPAEGGPQSVVMSRSRHIAVLGVAPEKVLEAAAAANEASGTFGAGAEVEADQDAVGMEAEEVSETPAQAEASADEAAILAWCRENMAAYKVPREIELCEALPRSPTGKVMWRHLQEQAWADSADA